MIDSLRYLLFGRYQFSRKALFYLKTFNNARILSIKICRNPLPDALTFLANHLSSESHFDELFHIYLIIDTDLGELLLEKNEQIHITNHISYWRDSEFFNIPIEDIPEGLEVGQLIEKTQKYMGVKAFFGYHISLNNCQHFVVSVLSACQIKSGNTFALQNISSIFCNHREARKIINEIVGYKTLLNRGYEEVSELNPLAFRRQKNL